MTPHGTTLKHNARTGGLRRGTDMADREPNSRELGRLYALSQVGFEMVAPIVVGLLLDNRFGWAPWGVVVGAVLGLGGGLWHLVVMLRRFDDRDSPPRQDSP